MGDKKENKFNLEDSKLAILFFTFIVFCACYVIFRLISLYFLRRFVSKKGHGIPMKMIMGGFPITFLTMMLVRTWNRTLNNMCAEFIPLSYLLRFFIHTSLLVLQLQVLLPAKSERILFRWKNRQGILGILVFFIASSPSIIFCSLMWAYGVGIQKAGVCTIGTTDGSDKILWGISGWLLVALIIEFTFFVINGYCSFAVRRAAHLTPPALRELKFLAEFSVFLIFFDFFFRMNIVVMLVMLVFDKGTGTVICQWYDLFFVCVYVGGIGTFMAAGFERDSIRYFKIGFPRPLFFKLLFRRTTIPPEKVQKYWEDRMSELQSGFHHAAARGLMGSNDGLWSSKDDIPLEPMDSTASELVSPIRSGEKDRSGV